MPLTLSAEAMAVGPETATTGMPRSAASRTRTLPGSLMQGVPASVVTATSMFSASIRSAIWMALLRSLCSWQLVSGVEMSKAFSSFMVTRVSSAAISCTARRVSMARGLMSPKLPMGVATT